MIRAFLLGLMAWAATAEVLRVELVERSDYAGGQSFGPAGPYEIVKAKAFFEADPSLAANKLVVDLHLAPRNERGKVEWSTDVYVLKPRDTSKGNGTLLYEVSNRGGRGLLNQFQRGDEFLLQQGFTLLWCGWQWDIPVSMKEGLRMYSPIATDNGKPIRGPVRAEYVPTKRTTEMWLGDRNHVPYPIVADAKLTVRSTGDGERQAIPASAFKVTQNGQAIEMAAGFEPGRIYELVYTAENPRIAGLGSAGIRDLVSFFRYPGGKGLLLNAESRFLKRAIAIGTSQSGRFLRKYLYDGFNADEKGRIVFDAIWAHVAGAGRGSFNHRFAQASRDGHPMMNFLYPSDLPPFTDEAIRAKAKAAGVEPKIFYTDGSYEYWGRGAALTHLREDGSADAPLTANSRRYYLTGTQHGAGQFPPPHNATTEYPANANDYRFAMRALLVGLNRWISTGNEPPASAYPLLSKGELVAYDKIKLPLNGVKTPARPHKVYKLDFGPEFEASGIVTKEPPAITGAFPVMVPQVDSNGNEIAGIRLPQISVPLATYTGWNYRTKQIGAAGEFFDMVGSTFPFPVAKVAQLYKDKDEYLAKTLAAGRELVRQRYLLEQDLLEILERAAKQWDGMAAIK